MKFGLLAHHRASAKARPTQIEQMPALAWLGKELEELCMDHRDSEDPQYFSVISIFAFFGFLVWAMS